METGKNNITKLNRIVISRTDGIGDVVLTLPLAGLLKKMFPQTEVIFIGKKYTRAVVNCCRDVDKFIGFDELYKLSDLNVDCIIHVLPDKTIACTAKKLKIPIRVGTSHRFFHWTTCNKLLNLSRKKSLLHESQLNLILATAIGAKKYYTLSEVLDFLHFEAVKASSFAVGLLDKKRFNLVLHPKSNGSGREWSEDKFIELIKLLPTDKFKIFISGTQAEGEKFREKLLTPFASQVTDLTGRMSLAEFISFLAQADGIVASGTGPLHLGAALGINAVGLFPPIHPINPERWSPVGKKTKVFVAEKNCRKCRRTKNCICMDEIKPKQIAEYLINLKKTV